MKGHRMEGKGGTISILYEVLQEANIMTTEEVATMGTAIDTGIGVEKTIGEAHTESGEADQGARLHLKVDLADLGQEGGILDPTVLQDDHQSIR